MSLNNQHGPSLPLDVISIIAEHLEFDFPLLNLSLTCKEVHRFLNPIRYSSLEICTTSRCKSQLKYLLQRPDLTRHIHTLILRPTYFKYPSKSKKIAREERAIAEALELLIPYLHSLRKFIWGGTETCKDAIWEALKNSCPKLTYVGTNVGRQPIDPDSHLFKFSNLLGFSLTTKGRYPVWFGECEDLPQSLWDMLILRSPNLEELVVGHRDTNPCSDRTFNVMPIVGATRTWANLHTLDLSNTMLFPFQTLTEAAERDAELQFSAFLEWHPLLHKFSLMRFRRLADPRTHSLDDNEQEDEDDDEALNKVYQLLYLSPQDRVLADYLLQRQAAWIGYTPLSATHGMMMQELDLCNVAVYPIQFPLFRTILQQHVRIKTFGVWVDLTLPDKGSFEDKMIRKEEYDFVQVLRSFLKHAPAGLEHFRFRCPNTYRSSPSWKQVPQLVAGTRLKSFELYKMTRFPIVLKSNDMRQAAIGLARSCSTLEKITLCSTRRSAEIDDFYETVKIAQEGVYHVARDGDNAARTLYANEKGGDVLFATASLKRYEVDLTSIA